ncbi:MAG: glycosyltransferase [Nitrospirota bacterium]
MNESPRLTVLFFISSLEGGGAERVMVDILRNFDKNRIEATLVLLYSSENSPYREFLPKDIEIIVARRKSDSIIQKLKQMTSFVTIVNKRKPDIILSMLTHNNIMALLAGIFFKIKVIISEHSTLSEIIKTREGNKILGLPVTFLVKVFYRFAERVIAVSEGIRSDLIQGFNIRPDKISVIYNPVDLNRIAALSSLPVEHPFFKDAVPLVISVGRFVWQKRFDTLIKAFSLVLKEIDARLILVGEGPEKEKLEKMVKGLQIEDKVFFTGFLNNPYKFLSKADIFALSSSYEGLPVAILEAMACGVPVISTDCRSGPREILQDGKSGLLVPVGDELSLSEAILTLLKNQPLREKFSRLGRERVNDFSVRKIVRQYENIILR